MVRTDHKLLDQSPHSVLCFLSAKAKEKNQTNLKVDIHKPELRIYVRKPRCHRNYVGNNVHLSHPA